LDAAFEAALETTRVSGEVPKVPSRVMIVYMKEQAMTIRRILSQIPYGKVCSYGGVAAMAGVPYGARTVARLLHSCSRVDQLPWWRVIRSDGHIALPRGGGFEEQAARLAEEGISVDSRGVVDLAIFSWHGPVPSRS
jgi:methylated-DNA-protein-cysteine methyltransferase related protein